MSLHFFPEKLYLTVIHLIWTDCDIFHVLFERKKYDLVEHTYFLNVDKSVCNITDFCYWLIIPTGTLKWCVCCFCHVCFIFLLSFFFFIISASFISVFVSPLQSTGWHVGITSPSHCKMIQNNFGTSSDRHLKLYMCIEVYKQIILLFRWKFGCHGNILKTN